MFHAQNKNGTTYTLYNKSKEEINKLKKTEVFHCPDCSEEVFIRSGPYTAPHFAHYPNSQCAAVGRGESEVHENGKWLLFKWLKLQQFDVQLEAYVPEINQRADLLLRLPFKTIAIEYQCSVISTSEIEKRTTSYLKAGIFPLWILGAEHYVTKARHTINWTRFLQTLVYHFHGSYHLYFLDVSAEKFIVASNIYKLTNTKCHHHLTVYPLSDLTFPQLLKPQSFSMHSLFQSWAKLMCEHRTKYKKFVSKQEERWRAHLYKKGLHFSLIPSVCYLPVKSQWMISERPYLWQTQLVVEHFLDLPIGESGRFPYKETVSCMNQHRANPVREYELLLSQLGYLEPTFENGWIKKKEIHFHFHIEQAMEEDKNIIKLLKKYQKS
ncbi:competence protein CoiA [Halobacillus salinarum]|uniref:Competence protein CoiA n=1 Tax=Halobacillus salinarum TaxID=2932257 RepID=A0ABY4EH16_9BACI|nr:competence protein CoiA family protein [Halobacillus salinarum]UOQ43426.1 competence protein CoiA [Halobacillus salinarum]